MTIAQYARSIGRTPQAIYTKLDRAGINKEDLTDRRKQLTEDGKHQLDTLYADQITAHADTTVSADQITAQLASVTDRAITAERNLEVLTAKNEALHAANEALSAQITLLQSQLAETRIDRDAWKEQAQRINVLLPSPDQQKKGFFARLFGSR